MRRFQLALARAARGTPDDWAAIAADCGFADQPHLMRECHAFAGMLPSAYLDRRAVHHTHVAIGSPGRWIP
ncbi:MAG: helix-turn-helix domain-containing protein [Acidobacteria bacterium]|nr:helix-turn-helix domain-containing protein [Acidobacteriota bacterium]